MFGLRMFASVVLAASVSVPVLAENSLPAAPVAPVAENPARDVRYPGVIALDVDATDTARRIIRVRQTIPVAAPGPMTLRYAEWLPGNHAPRGPVAAIAGLKVSAGGKSVAWKRSPLDVYAFDIVAPEGAATIDVAFEWLTPTDGDQGRVVMTPDIVNLQWEKAALYPAGHYVRQIRVRPSVKLPAGWTGFSALDGAVRDGDTLRFAETDFETLVDSPMFAGRNAKSWDLGQGVTLSTVADRASDLAASNEQITLHSRMVDQAIKLFGARHFDRYHFLLALSDELGGIGLEHHRSSENATARGYFTDWRTTPSLRGLLPHEMTHSWNGKFRRPADLWTPDYRTPMQNSLLWVYEGQTAYWDNVIGARAGLIPVDVVLGEMAVHAAYYGAQAGRSWKPLVDTTNDPITNARRPQAYRSYQRSEDYYNEAALVWLEADTLIREKTGGRKSLDDFAQRFFGIRDGDWGVVTYTFDDVVAALDAVMPHDWAGFLKARVDNLAPPPMAGIERGGYRLVFKEVPNPFQLSVETQRKQVDLSYSIGTTLKPSGEVDAVMWDSPAFAAGIVNGNRIVAVNGMAFSPDEIKGAITAAKSGAPITLIVQQGSRYRTVNIDYRGGLRFPHLERAGSGPALLDRILLPRK